MKWSFVYVLSFVVMAMAAQEKDPKEAIIYIDTTQGHVLQEGSSGFNVRIADKVWSYSHPDFKAAVHGLKPGWLRYFSGTMGDAFNSATGLYDKDYALMFDHQQAYFKGYEFTQVKGPHRIIDLYHLLGEVGGKLIVTINGYSETPKVAEELARFCKNNNIEVEVWQFCNEPYFYVPHRERYWWNDGYDYAAKMKPYGDAIRRVFPDAKLALNCSWDGIWGFMKEIHSYQEENGAWWDVFSKHSYAPHVGGREPFEKAYKRGNTKVIEATDKTAMAEIERYTWQGVPMIITEFGVWNAPLNGIYSAIYNAEYTLRQLAHPNLQYIGSHEISNKYKPAINRNNEILHAYKNGLRINTDTMRTGVKIDDEGNALALVHEATNNTSYTWDTKIQGGARVEGLKGTQVEAMYARAFKGINGYDYLLVTNRSAISHNCKVMLGELPLSGNVSRRYMFSEIPANQNIPVIEDEVSANPLNIPPFSVVLIKWESNVTAAPATPRIYKISNVENGVLLHWWKRDIAQGYQVAYGTDKAHLNKVMDIQGCANTSITLTDLKKGQSYFFAVSAYNSSGKSEFSSPVHLTHQRPKQPKIFKTARRDTTLTVMWESVANADGYWVSVLNQERMVRYDAKNVFGYRIEGLKYDTPYKISVTAYNGLGEGPASEELVLTCKKHIPLPPRNISAKATANGTVKLAWIIQDTINPHVKYRIYRGEKLHEFTPLADGIELNYFEDKSIKPGESFYYTVKAYNEDGECDYYPNIATIIKVDKQLRIEVSEIQTHGEAVRIKIKFTNIKLDGDIRYGVAISDVSYLTEEEVLYESDEVAPDYFWVSIPKSDFKTARKYAIKGFVNTNGKSIYSLPPHKTLKL